MTLLFTALYSRQTCTVVVIRHNLYPLWPVVVTPVQIMMLLHNKCMGKCLYVRLLPSGLTEVPTDTSGVCLKTAEYHRPPQTPLQRIRGFFKCYALYKSTYLL